MALSQGGALLDAVDVNTTPVPTEGTASVKLIGVAEMATAAEPDAFEPRAEGIEGLEARHTVSEPV
jgi:hypothetical protein